MFRPHRLRQLLGKADAHHGLGAFDAVLPRHADRQRRTVGLGQRRTVNAQCHKRQRMHRFVDAQPFNVRPRNIFHFTLTAQIFRIKYRGEFHEFRVARRFDAFGNFRKRITRIRNHQRPAFGTAHAVDALLQRSQAHEIINIKSARLVYLTFDGDRPRTSGQSDTVCNNVFFEFTKTRGGDHVFQRRKCFARSTERTFDQRGKRILCMRKRSCAQHAAHTQRACRRKPAAAIGINILRRNFRGLDIGWMANQHVQHLP